MFDFQIAEDAGVCRDVIEKTKERQRQWYG
jgi:hypothetical protein